MQQERIIQMGRKFIDMMYMYEQRCTKDVIKIL